MRLIDVDAAIDCIKSGIKEDGNFESDAIHLIEFLNVFARSNKVEALPMDKLCELCEKAGARVPCVICSKIMPEWCKEHNNLPLSWDEKWKCPSWKAILTKWMEEQDAADRL